MKRKVLYFDTETTGPDPTTHSIIEIAGIIEIDRKVVEEFEFNVAPWEEGEIDEQSIEVHGISIEEMKSFPKPEYVHQQLNGIFSRHIDKFDREDKFILAGQRIQFDLDMLINFYYRIGDKYLGSYIDFRGNNRIELLKLTDTLRMLGYCAFENLKLETICKTFGIAIEAHNAKSDIRATRECINHILSRLTWTS